MTPNMGQGANQAIEDAATLAALLDRAGDIDRALTGYDRIRRPRTQDISRRSRRIGAVAHLTSGPAALRDLTLRLTLVAPSCVNSVPGDTDGTALSACIRCRSARATISRATIANVE
jgi:2-polyprenyl-6-methoxyphenol hydroxylase-like FAD-dependent oxidoreductase